MTDICPTITVETKPEFDRQLNNVRSFAERIHIDLADGTLAPRALLSLADMSWPEAMRVDLHVMCDKPESIVNYISVDNRPDLVILHAEANGNFFELANRLKSLGVQVGIALLQPTSPQTIKPALKAIDHVLIFSGNLGYQGGSSVDLKLLEKADVLKQWKPMLELGWDGGVNDGNVADLVRGGIDVINVGGFIQSAQDPQAAYAKLEAALK